MPTPTLHALFTTCVLLHACFTPSLHACFNTLMLHSTCGHSMDSPPHQYVFHHTCFNLLAHHPARVPPSACLPLKYFHAADVHHDGKHIYLGRFFVVSRPWNDGFLLSDLRPVKPTLQIQIERTNTFIRSSWNLLHGTWGNKYYIYLVSLFSERVTVPVPSHSLICPKRLLCNKM